MRKIVCCGLLIMFLPTVALADMEGGCDRLMQANPQPELGNWDGLYKWYTKICTTDDGFVAEAYDGVVMDLLTQKWNQLGRLKILTTQNKDFRRLVLEHVSMTSDRKGLKMILKNARQHCPDDTAELCQALMKSAQEGLRNQN